MPDAREILFPYFSRKVGNPTQYLINSFDELNHFANINSGQVDDVFCSSCAYDGNTPFFHDIFHETDDTNPEPVRKVVLWYEERKISYIILLSGNRGFHIHGNFKLENVNQKTIKSFANLILKETNTTEFFDPAVTGDIKRLCRIPNTQRITGGWCVPITREELFSINDPKDFKKLCSAPRFLDFPEPERPSIFQFIKEEPEEIKPIQNITISPPKDFFRLKDILRPCVYKAILTPNPRNDFRICMVLECLNHGLSSNQIYNICLHLNWIDLDPSKTHYNIDYIEEKRKSGEFVIPFGKKRLGCTNKISCLTCVLTRG